LTAVERFEQCREGNLPFTDHGKVGIDVFQGHGTQNGNGWTAQNDGGIGFLTDDLNQPRQIAQVPLNALMYQVLNVTDGETHHLRAEITGGGAKLFRRSPAHE
jgi:hypothetical protein